MQRARLGRGGVERWTGAFLLEASKGGGLGTSTMVGTADGLRLRLKTSEKVIIFKEKLSNELILTSP
jgi:hypothetical protein